MKNPEQFLSELKSAGLLRVLRNVECLPGGMARMEDGREVVNLASNDYLGLARHPALVEAFSRAARDGGAGAMASRLVTGTRRAHSGLEDALAALKGTEAALSFSSGYATSLGVITSIVDREDTVLMDKLSHASLIDGARLSGARLSTFLHNDMESLRKKLERLRETNPSSGILVVTESVFSMDGDRAPLREMVRLKDEFGALLLVDEAHGFGVLGEHGAGLGEELGVSSRIDFQMGTLSKAAGLSGGYVACSRAWADVMVNSARSLIYSTAPPPALAAAALAAVEVIRSAEGKELRRHVSVLADMLSATLGMPGRPVSSIFPVVIGENGAALEAAAALLERGFLAPAIRYPTVPRGTARLRITVTAAHRTGQIEQLGRELAELLHGS
ncbi:8-amino-7-oxononanoate synthase [uncultured Akkermansia sp.]|uniref:aminotransferase class I/II-fold pyridoxal phosphate-dependent enzyme n=1 Tax=uncultured Akkermansia sp. TaxID=512294 RepID=UPI0025DAD985|nr:8-amino-7-oxononanoate synthase [uncultured Akkermansia sp.]